jgi:hypothetical protein
MINPSLLDEVVTKSPREIYSVITTSSPPSPSINRHAKKVVDAFIFIRATLERTNPPFQLTVAREEKEESNI